MQLKNLRFSLVPVYLKTCKRNFPGFPKAKPTMFAPPRWLKKTMVRASIAGGVAYGASSYVCSWLPQPQAVGGIEQKTQGIDPDVMARIVSKPHVVIIKEYYNKPKLKAPRPPKPPETYIGSPLENFEEGSSVDFLLLGAATAVLVVLCCMLYYLIRINNSLHKNTITEEEQINQSYSTFLQRTKKILIFTWTVIYTSITVYLSAYFMYTLTEITVTAAKSLTYESIMAACFTFGPYFLLGLIITLAHYFQSND